MTESSECDGWMKERTGPVSLISDEEIIACFFIEINMIFWITLIHWWSSWHGIAERHGVVRGGRQSQGFSRCCAGDWDAQLDPFAADQHVGEGDRASPATPHDAQD